jgi:hypothetical protein
MSRKWVVVDTNIFRFTSYEIAGEQDRRERDHLFLGGEAQAFLSRMVEHCDEYGLAVDAGGLIIEEYEGKIPKDSFGYYAFRQMATRIPGKISSFRHVNPDWAPQLQGDSRPDRHDFRFLATAWATPDKVLVTEDTVFVGNIDLLRLKGLQVYNAEQANRDL